MIFPFLYEMYMALSCNTEVVQKLDNKMCEIGCRKWPDFWKNNLWKVHPILHHAHTVSYTHLDVYKRQELENVVEVNIIERAASPYANLLVAVRRKKVGKVI